ncbi:ferredoxin-type protein NapF [Nitrogeniibacter mangrovi]|uniref:Ferredoxin-type protein NapF n=1 Tax=Nitrogeniibacter mangrovi TaxID=2016596 RepID=A0A6C1B6S7_9RHOO|nr:ferredoxin-type protein NapF [Nitrogeniibacter mangrovi]QID19452.1 ferredoxin-type protein NapF [Nitrogeniibacter mangrovi]
MDAARRGFLRGRLSRSAHVPRPPWAVAPGQFEQLCTRCGDCVTQCPTRIIRSGEGGYPTLDFSAGECTFCGDCVAACAPHALHRADGVAPWALKAVIGDRCLTGQGVECRICAENCDAGAIRCRPALGGIARPELQSDRCTGCGACVAPCPVGAIGVAQSNPMEIEQ